MAGYPTMREANVVRGIEWSNGAKDGTQFYAVELAGEVGELLNVIKKLERERLGMVGSRASTQDLADELADVVICLDLLAIAYDRGVITRYNAADDFTQYDALSLSVIVGRAVGQVMGWVERLEGEMFFGGYAPQTLRMLDESLRTALMFVNGLSQKFDIDLAKAVSAKFNKTSDKYGLLTKMADDAEFI